MPRIPTQLVLKAHQLNPLIRLLLQECRTLDSAHSEFCWLRERAHNIAGKRGKRVDSATSFGWRSALRSMCQARSKGIPLQYILGDQPFGDLEILCRRGVLIPRSETESLTIHAAEVILQRFRQGAFPDTSVTSAPLRIIDLCSGTGCISLLLHSLLAPHFDQMSILGIDISPKAVQLARENLHYNFALGRLSDRAPAEVQYYQGDVLRRGEGHIPGIDKVIQEYFLSHHSSEQSGCGEKSRCDVLISNPPYISPESFRNGTTARSVRIFEPTIALVPPASTHPLMIKLQGEDLFYQNIISLALKLRPKLTVLECGDRLQAGRVSDACRAFAASHGELTTISTEIWPHDIIGRPFSSSEACAVLLYI